VEVTAGIGADFNHLADHLVSGRHPGALQDRPSRHEVRCGKLRMLASTASGRFDGPGCGTMQPITKAATG
jgi:hypothetical protein